MKMFLILAIFLTACQGKEPTTSGSGGCHPLSSYNPPQWVIDQVGLTIARQMSIEACGACQFATIGPTTYKSCQSQ